ncbi:hypothetical protein LJ207_01260 [Halanaerobium sp. Z-7514]|uniref:VanZ-like domain-containing protein n=1 Tax=Halanaerobium polyolivorans TaxID=2886943 RepID=A0AAW4WS90_9FIRM|nr:hypothetical protein [Halanaerobium polyolivorans]MCC3143950.1 hypothetical protein [Halanaerobium polyolivorans]RQD71671.1 MAG: hypothetical protein D5S01_09735 [Halanaerobium sp. MSAO_Bac5]
MGKKFYYFLLRFTIVHLITYVFIGVLFMNVQSYANIFISIEHFESLRASNSLILRTALLWQLLRGLFLAAILYPFYGIIIKSEYALLKLFFLILGLSILGSLFPAAGSIEGFIYRDLLLTDHLTALAKAAIQIFVFSWFFVKWENRTERDYS